MIWIVFLILLLLAGFYILRPFLVSMSWESDAMDEARAQRAAIDTDAAEGRLTPQAASEARDALDRRILALLDTDAPSASATHLKSLALVAVPAILLLGGAG
ncbi:MAG: c-type cytochrome biogenesis protein CcmI, partial [Pseudomonadota bacterium]